MSNPKQSYSTTATAAYDAVYYSHEIALLLQSQLCIKMLRVGRFDYNTLLLLRKANIIFFAGTKKHSLNRSAIRFVVSREGLEPSTPSLRGSCSNQLSYRPTLALLYRNS